MNGLELQRRLRQAGFKIPALFLTAHHEERLRQAAIGLGAIDMLKKPFDAAVFLALVKQAVSDAT